MPHKRHLCNPASLRLSVMKTRLPVLLLYTWSAKALLGALLSLLVQEATTAGCGGMVRACHPGTQKVEAGSSEVQGKPVLRKILSQTKTNRKGQTSHAPHSLYSKEALGRVPGGTVMSSAAGQNPTALNNKPCCPLGSLALSEGMPLPIWLSPFQTLPRSLSHRQISLPLSCIHRPWISHGEGDHHFGKTPKQRRSNPSSKVVCPLSSFYQKRH